MFQKGLLWQLGLWNISVLLMRNWDTQPVKHINQLSKNICLYQWQENESLNDYKQKTSLNSGEHLKWMMLAQELQTLIA